MDAERRAETKGRPRRRALAFVAAVVIPGGFLAAAVWFAWRAVRARRRAAAARSGPEL